MRLKDLLTSERLREHFLQRSVGLVVALLLEGVLLLLLITLGIAKDPDRPLEPALSTFDVTQASEEPQTEQAQPEQAQTPQQPADTQIRPDTPEPIQPAPAPLLPVAPVLAPAPATPPKPRAVIRSDQSYGPVNTGRPGPPDSEVVGTAPDGSPLYAAAWYREPYDNELRGYLSTASGPGWGLIACRTAPEWRVEDCEIVDEWPIGSGIARAAKAAAWQFQVRPPRLAGKYQVGAWVRIRIVYH